MRVMLLANQPERTTRLQLFRSTLEELGHEVLVPIYSTRNWIKIARQVRSHVKSERPEVVHVFNVPDVIYHRLPSLKGRYFDHLIYDYRSPWGVETQMRFGRLGRYVCEAFERELARGADVITTVNGPLRHKVRCYEGRAPVQVIPNYPSRSFLEARCETAGPAQVGEVEQALPSGGYVIFVGRVCEQEGVANVMKLARLFQDLSFCIVGGGPFAWWYLRNKPANVIDLGWQPHGRVANLVSRADLCIIPRDRNVLTPYSTDKSIWKLNEYLNLGRPVLASGITREEDRKNLMVMEKERLGSSLVGCLERGAERMGPEDYRFWEGNRDRIREAYEGLA